MGLKDRSPYLMWGGKIDPLSEIRNAGIITTGKVFWVKDPSDEDYLTLKDSVGQENFFDTIQAAIDKCVSDRNDYVMVCPKKDGAAWALTAAIDLNEDRVHLISVGYNRTNVGYSNVIEGYAATTAHDTEFINVSGKGCEIAGFQFRGTGAATAAAAVTGTVTGGMLYTSTGADDLWVHDCSLDLMGSSVSSYDKLGGIIASAATVAGLRLENVAVHMGTLNSGTVVIIKQGAECKDWVVKDSTFTFLAGDTDHEPIVCGTGDIGMFLFDNCKFVNTNAGTAPASLAVGDVTPDQGVVLFHYCSGVNITTFGTDDCMFQAPTIPGATAAADAVINPGIAVTGTATIPVGK